MTRWSFSTVQSIVALVAGVLSIAGTTYSALNAWHREPTAGELAAVVADASTGRPVPDAVVEVRTPQDAIVAQHSDGIVHETLPEGAYRLRVVHPHFADAVRDVVVVAGHRTDVRVALVAAPTPLADAPHVVASRRPDPVHETPGRALDRGVTATRRFLGRLGL